MRNSLFLIRIRAPGGAPFSRLSHFQPRKGLWISKQNCNASRSWNEASQTALEVNLHQSTKHKHETTEWKIIHGLCPENLSLLWLLFRAATLQEASAIVLNHLHFELDDFEWWLLVCSTFCVCPGCFGFLLLQSPGKRVSGGMQLTFIYLESMLGVVVRSVISYIFGLEKDSKISN